MDHDTSSNLSPEQTATSAILAGFCAYLLTLGIAVIAFGVQGALIVFMTTISVSAMVLGIMSHERIERARND